MAPDAPGPSGPPDEPPDDGWHGRVGQRVVVLRRLPDGGRTEVVGDLTSAGDHLSLVTRSGPVDIPRADVLGGKVVPPRPVRRGPPHLATSITDLEAVMSLHWRPAGSERLGGWVLRAAGGFTNRANSVLPLGAPPATVEDALATAAAWYTARDLPPRASIAAAEPGGVPDDHGPTSALAEQCRAAGWRVIDGGSALVLTARTAGLRPPGGVSALLPAGLDLDVSPVPDDQWLASYRYRGQDLPPHAVALLLSAPAQAFFSIRDGGRTVGVARGSFGGGWAGVTAVDVLPSHRRRGLATALLAAVADWAGRSGAMSMFLQVSDTNMPAITLYSGAGFAVHHRYDYWQAPTAVR